MRILDIRRNEGRPIQDVNRAFQRQLKPQQIGRRKSRARRRLDDILRVSHPNDHLPGVSRTQHAPQIARFEVGHCAAVPRIDPVLDVFAPGKAFPSSFLIRARVFLSLFSRRRGRPVESRWFLDFDHDVVRRLDFEGGRETLK